MSDSELHGDEAEKAARWAEGCRRHEAIRRLIERHGSSFPRSDVEDVAWELGVSRATLYRLIDLYRTFGTVDMLQPRTGGRRAGTKVLSDETEQLIENTIREVYLKPTRPTLTHLVHEVHARCVEKNLPLPHRRTVRARVKAIDARVRGLKRAIADFG